MPLLENIIIFINKYFYKTEEKPVKYAEWLTSEYTNGVWYICEDNIPTPVPGDGGVIQIINMNWRIAEAWRGNGEDYCIIRCDTSFPNEQYNNIIWSQYVESHHTYEDNTLLDMDFDYNANIPTGTIIATIPDTQVNNKLYKGCKVIRISNDDPTCKIE